MTRPAVAIPRPSPGPWHTHEFRASRRCKLKLLVGIRPTWVLTVPRLHDGMRMSHCRPETIGRKRVSEQSGMNPMPNIPISAAIGARYTAAPSVYLASESDGSTRHHSAALHGTGTFKMPQQSTPQSSTEIRRESHCSLTIPRVPLVEYP